MVCQKTSFYSFAVDRQRVHKHIFICSFREELLKLRGYFDIFIYNLQCSFSHFSSYQIVYFLKQKIKKSKFKLFLNTKINRKFHKDNNIIQMQI